MLQVHREARLHSARIWLSGLHPGNDHGHNCTGSTCQEGVDYDKVHVSIVPAEGTSTVEPYPPEGKDQSSQESKSKVVTRNWDSFSIPEFTYPAPTRSTPARAEYPPIECTTPEPAKSWLATPIARTIGLSAPLRRARSAPLHIQ